MPKSVDYIIVGQGLAGSTLAYKLIKNEATVLVIDEEATSTSSKIAAGMFTPVSGKRLTETWMAKEFLTALKTTYAEMENWTQEKFITYVNIQQSFASVKEQNDFYATRAENMEAYLIQNPTLHNGLQCEFGGFEITQSGWLNMEVFLSAVRQKLTATSSYIKGVFNYSDLTLTETNCLYQGINAKAIIFCQGHQSLNNPYFANVPIIPNQGDVFLIETNVLDNTKIYKRGAYAVGLTNQLFKVGSTYHWNVLNQHPTPAGYDELKHKTNALINGQYKVLKHLAGIRPTTKDRKPILGKHATLPLFIFNGLGTKGVMVASYFSDVMASFITNQTILGMDISTERFQHDSTQL